MVVVRYGEEVEMEEEERFFGCELERFFVEIGFCVDG